MSFAVYIAILAGLVLGFIYYFLKKKGDPRYTLLYFFFMFPLIDYKVIAVDYGNYKMFDILVFMILVFGWREFFRKLNVLRIDFILIVLLFTALIIGALSSEHPTRSLLYVGGVLPPFIFLRFLILEARKDPGFIRGIFRIVKYITIIAVVFTIVQTFVGSENFNLYGQLNINVLGGDIIRYPGIFYDAQANGLFFALISFLWLYNFKEFGRVGFSQLFLIGFTLFGLFLSGSRSPVLGIAGALLFLLLFSKGKMRSNLVVFFLIIGVSLFFFLQFVEIDPGRFQSLDEAYEFRNEIWQGALEIFREHPLLGIGVGNYQSYIMKYDISQSLLLPDNEVLYLGQPENGYLAILTEWGGIASFFLFLLILSPIIRTIRDFFYGRSVGPSVLSSAALICFMIAFMSVYSLSDRRIVIVITLYISLTILFAEKSIVPDEN